MFVQLWKVTKVVHVRVRGADAAERRTAHADAEAMRYLSMLLYPLCVAGALYSLVYEPHKR